MPRQIDTAVAPKTIPNDPTNQISVNPTNYLSANPDSNMAEAVLFGAVNTFLDAFDSLTGLDLKDFAVGIENSIFGGASSFVSDMQSVFSFIGGIGGTLSSFVTGAIGGIINAITNGLNLTGIVNSTVDMVEAGIGGLVSSVSSIGNIVGQLWAGLGSIGSTVVQAVTGSDPGTYTDIGSILDGVHTGLSGLTTLAGDAFSGLGGLIDGIFNSLTGQGQSGLAYTDATGQLAYLQNTVTAHGAAIAELQAVNNATTNSGMSGGDSFDTATTVDLGSGWQILSATTGMVAYSDGNNATITSGLPGTVRAIRIDPDDAVTLTDFQLMTVTIGSPLESTPFGDTNPGCNHIYGRMSADGTYYVVVKIYDQNATLSYATGGAETVLTSVGVSQNSGSTFGLACGTVNGSDIYLIIKDNKVIREFTDNSGVISVGANYRHWGLGWTADTSFGRINGPSGIDSCTVCDNIPAEVVGHGFRVFRQSGANFGTTTGASSIGLCFDTFDYITQDCGNGWSGGSFTAPITGWWIFDLRVQSNGALPVSNNCFVGLYVDGSGWNQVKAWSGAAENVRKPTGSSVSGDAGTVDSLGKSFTLYLNKGDVVTPYAYSAFNIIGNADSSQTYFSGVLVSS